MTRGVKCCVHARAVTDTREPVPARHTPPPAPGFLDLSTGDVLGKWFFFLFVYILAFKKDLVNIHNETQPSLSVRFSGTEGVHMVQPAPLRPQSLFILQIRNGPR